jgi:hypothetical protein
MTAYTVFGKPLYVWGGIITGVFFALTVITGLTVGRFGVKVGTHKMFAAITAFFALLHAAGGLYAWFFY